MASAPTQIADPAARPLVGVLWMLVTGANFVAVTAIVKYVGSDLPAAQSAFLRYALGLVFVLPMLGAMRRAPMTRRWLALFGLRGLVHSIGVILWFFAMTQIPLAEVTAMGYVSPVFVTLGAALFLGEKLALRRIAAVAAALVGALIILRPGLREVSGGHYAMMLNAVLFASSYLIAKGLTERFEPPVIVGWMAVFVTIGLFPFALAVWVTPTPGQVGWMLLTAVFATAGHYTMTLALRAAPVSVTQPVTFLQLLWATLLGALVFGEKVDLFVVLGGTLILASVSFITWREARLKRRAVTPASMATKT